jgi:L-cystine transport system permease protein
MTNFSVPFFFQTLLAALAAVPRSLGIALGAAALGTLLGLPAGLARFYRVPVVTPLLRAYVMVLKGVPTILLFLIFYLVLANVPFLTKSLVTVVALTVPASIAMSEIFRGSLESIDKSQFDAAASVGHTRGAAFFRIILPQLVPVSLPMTGNVCIGMIKSVALATIIGVMDILNSALLEATVNYRYLEAYFGAAVVYWGLCVLIERLFLYFEKRYTYKARSCA